MGFRVPGPRVQEAIIQKSWGSCSMKPSLLRGPHDRTFVLVTVKFKGGGYTPRA